MIKYLDFTLHVTLDLYIVNYFGRIGSWSTHTKLLILWFDLGFLKGRENARKMKLIICFHYLWLIISKKNIIVGLMV